MNVLFFLGFFGKIILNCGVEDFKKRYNFEYEDFDENKKLFDKDIEYGIDIVFSEIIFENLIYRL